MDKCFEHEYLCTQQNNIIILYYWGNEPPEMLRTWKFVLNHLTNKIILHFSREDTCLYQQAIKSQEIIQKNGSFNKNMRQNVKHLKG